MTHRSIGINDTIKIASIFIIDSFEPLDVIVKKSSVIISESSIEFRFISCNKILIKSKDLIKYNLTIDKISFLNIICERIEFEELSNVKIEFEGNISSENMYVKCVNMDVCHKNEKHSRATVINLFRTTFSKFSVKDLDNMMTTYSINVVEDDKHVSMIHKFEICNSNVSNTVYVSDLTIGNLEISSSYISYFHLSNSYINSLKLIKIRGKYVFSDLQPFENVNNVLKLVSVNLLNSLIFNNSSLSQYEIELEDSDITGSVFKNTTLPYRVNMTYKDFKDQFYYKTHFFRQRKDIILQLRKIADSKSDNYTIHQLKSLEQEVNYRLISLKNDPLNKVVLFLSKYTNSHGRNWLFPILWYFVVGVFTYSLIVLINGQDINFISMSIFLNPTHKIDDVFGEISKLRPVTGWIDYLTRIVLAYLAVQTVTAFRKTLK